MPGSTLGDAGGMDDFRESVALSVAAGQGRDIAINTINMGVWVWLYDGPAAGIVPIREAIDIRPLRLRRAVNGDDPAEPAGPYGPGAYDEALEILTG